MSELEGMINGILSNPDEMKKIMDMAGKIMGQDGGGSGTAPPNSAPAAAPSLDNILSGLNTDGMASAAGNLFGAGGLQNLLGNGGIQKLLGSPTVQRLIGSPVVQSLVGSAVNTRNDKKELFEALKPYLSEERRYKLDKAIVFAKVMRIAGVAGVAALKKGG